MTDHDRALREVAALISAALRKCPPELEDEIYHMAFLLGPDALAGAQAVERALREALGLKACLCAADGPGEVIPPACPVHGTPCDQCGGLEDCEDWCGADPAGTVTDLASGGPRTVFRDGDRLVIPPLRLDAKGCALLRQVINNEIADLAGARGQLAEDEAGTAPGIGPYAGHLRFPAIPAGSDDPHRLRMDTGVAQDEAARAAWAED